MTNRIPKGTSNITINVAEAEARLLGKLACMQDRSRGNLLKRAWLKALEEEEPEAAAEIRRIREDRRRAAGGGQTLGLILMAGWLTAMTVGGSMGTERQGRTVRPSRNRAAQRVVRRREAAGIFCGEGAA